MILLFFCPVKSPSSDLTWNKGAKRLMANLDRWVLKRNMDIANLGREVRKLSS